VRGNRLDLDASCGPWNPYAINRFGFAFDPGDARMYLSQGKANTIAGIDLYMPNPVGRAFDSVVATWV